MIRHMLKMLWSRRRGNFLIILEIMVSFLVLAVITTTGVYYYINYRQPLGFDYTNVWNIKTNLISRTKEWSENDTRVLNQLYNTLRDFPEIESIGTGWPGPYEMSEWNSVYNHGEKLAMAWGCNVALAFNEVFRIVPAEGRWFDSSDRAAGIRAAVINKVFSQRLFGDTDPVGKIISEGEVAHADGNNAESKQYRVVGVIDCFKIKGEFWDANPVLLVMGKDLSEPKAMENFMIRVSPGTSAQLEEKITGRFRAIAGNLTVKIERLEDARRFYFKTNIIPLLSAGLVALFLLIMVGLGLVGILWLGVSKRVQEIGLRRAKGATKGNIYGQITGEILCVTTIGLVLGFAVAIQFPLLNLIEFVTTRVYMTAMLKSAIIIYILASLSGFYPGYLAAKIHPAEALRGE